MLWVLLFVLLVPSILAGTVVISACMLSSRISQAESHATEFETTGVIDGDTLDRSNIRPQSVIPHTVQPDVDRQKQKGASTVPQRASGPASPESESIPFPTPTT